MIIEAFQSLFEPTKVAVVAAFPTGQQLFTADEAQSLGEDLLVAAAKARRVEADRNQPHLFLVSDLLSGRPSQAELDRRSSAAASEWLSFKRQGLI